MNKLINSNIILKIVLVFVFPLLITQVSAQEAVESEEIETKLSYFDFTLMPVYPTNTFNDKYMGSPFGFSIAYTKQRKPGRLDFLGAQFNYAHLGALTTLFTDLEARTGSNMMNLQLLYRHFPNFFFWKFEPFIEASFGPQWMYTISTTTLFANDATDIRFEESDFGITYAVGAGFTFYIADGFMFMSKANFASSTSMTYLVEGEDLGGFPIENFSPETSPINNIQLHFGISYVF